jgi:hypothetical protein
MILRLKTTIGLASLSLLGLLAGGCASARSAPDAAAAPEPDPKAPICEPNSVYGPRPCDSDEGCVEERGEGWYCDRGHTYDDGCGGTIQWPVCEKK